MANRVARFATSGSSNWPNRSGIPSALRHHLWAAEWFEVRDLVLCAEHPAKAEDGRAAAGYLAAGNLLADALRFETTRQVFKKGREPSFRFLRRTNNFPPL